MIAQTGRRDETPFGGRKPASPVGQNAAYRPAEATLKVVCKVFLYINNQLIHASHPFHQFGWMLDENDSTQPLPLPFLSKQGNAGMQLPRRCGVKRG